MKINKSFFLLVILFVLSTGKPLVSWKYCYSEPLTDNFRIHSAGAKIINGRVDLHVNMTLKEPITSGIYQYEIWHSETGDKIQYK